MALSPGVVPSYRIAIPHYWEGLVNEDRKGAATLTDFRHHLRHKNLRIVGEAGAEHDNRRRELRAANPDFSEYMISTLMYQEEQKERQEAEQERLRLAEILESRSKRQIQVMLQRAEPPVAIGLDGRHRTMSRDTRQWLSEHQPRELEKWDLVLAAATQREREEKLARVPDLWAIRHEKLEKKVAAEAAALKASHEAGRAERARVESEQSKWTDKYRENKKKLDEAAEAAHQKKLQELAAKVEAAARRKAAHDHDLAQKLLTDEETKAQHAAAARARDEASPSKKKASICHTLHPAKPVAKPANNSNASPRGTESKGVRFATLESSGSAGLGDSLGLRELSFADADTTPAAGETPPESEPSSPSAFSNGAKKGDTSPRHTTTVLAFSKSLTESRSEHIRIRDEKARARRARQEAAAKQFAKEAEDKRKAAALAAQKRSDEAYARVEAAMKQKEDQRRAAFEAAKQHEDKVIAAHEEHLVTVAEDMRRRLTTHAGQNRVNYAAREAERLARAREIELEQFSDGKAKRDAATPLELVQSPYDEEITMVKGSWKATTPAGGAAESSEYTMTAHTSYASALSPRPPPTAPSAPVLGGNVTRMDEATRAALVREYEKEQQELKKKSIDEHEARIRTALANARERSGEQQREISERERRAAEKEHQRAQKFQMQQRELGLHEGQLRWQIRDAENFERRDLLRQQREDLVVRRQAAAGVATEGLRLVHAIPKPPATARGATRNPLSTPRPTTVSDHHPSTAPKTARPPIAKERHDELLESQVQQRRALAEANDEHMRAVEAARRAALSNKAKAVVEYRKERPPSPSPEARIKRATTTVHSIHSKVGDANTRREESLEKRRSTTSEQLRRKAEITAGAAQLRSQWVEEGDAKAQERRVRHANRFVLVQPRAASFNDDATEEFDL